MLFVVFLGVAVLMLVVAVLTGMSTGRKLAREQSALGQVTAMTERKDSDGNSFFYPVVAFDVPDGGRYNVQLSEGSWPPSHRVGDLVTVLYDALNPLDARLQGGMSGLWIVDPRDGDSGGRVLGGGGFGVVSGATGG